LIDKSFFVKKHIIVNKCSNNSNLKEKQTTIINILPSVYFENY